MKNWKDVMCFIGTLDCSDDKQYQVAMAVFAWASLVYTVLVISIH